MAIVGGAAYVPDEGVIRKVDLSTAVVTTIAGTGATGCVDSTNPLTAHVYPTLNFVADGNSLFWLDSCSPPGTVTEPLRTMDLSTGAVSTVATLANIHNGLTVGPSGELYAGYGGELDEIDPTSGAVTTVVSSFPVPSSVTGCYPAQVQSLAADASSVWVSVYGGCPGGAPGANNWSAIFSVDVSTYAVALLTGTAQEVFDFQPNEPILTAPTGPGALVSAGGYLYSQGLRLLRFSKSTGAMTSIAGASGGYLDGTGDQAWMSPVAGIDTDGTNLWILDTYRLREVSPASAVSTTQPAAWSSTVTLSGLVDKPFAGSGTSGHVDGAALSAQFVSPSGIHVVGGDAYVLDVGWMRKIDLTTGAVSTVAGDGSTTFWCDESTNPAAVGLIGQAPMTDDGSFLYWTSGCNAFGNFSIMRMSLTTNAVSRVIQRPYEYYGLTVGPDGSLYAAHGQQIDRIDVLTGLPTTLATLPGTFSNPQVQLTADSTNLWANITGTGVSDHNVVFKVDPTTGATTSILDDPPAPGETPIEAPFVSSGSYLYAKITIASDPHLYPHGIDGMVRITKSTGALAIIAVAPLGQDMDFHGSDLFMTDTGTDRVYELFQAPASGPTGTQGIGGSNTAQNTVCLACKGAPIDLDTGAAYETDTDLAVPGRGPALGFARTYDTRQASTAGTLGYGWTDSYNWSLTVGSAPDPLGGPTPVAGAVTITQDNGSTNTFYPGPGGGYLAPSRVLATLTHNSGGTWTYIVRRSMTYTFSSAGQLTSITDLNGYTTTLSYNGSGQLATVTDPAGRTLTIAYDGSGRIHTVTDPLPRTVTYTYDASNNLQTVTDADGQVWTYGYDASHRLTTVKDPRGNTTTNHYDGSGRVDSQTDRRGNAMTFSYSGVLGGGTNVTTFTDRRGDVSTYTYLNGRLMSETQGVGTAQAATTSYGYDDATNAQTSITDGNGHTSTATYDVYGDQLTATDALSHTTTRTYNAYGEPLTMTDPLGVTTTYTYDTNGNLTSTSTPLVGSSPAASQVVTNAYGGDGYPGDLTQVTDPRGKHTAYTYDADGDLASVTDPTGDETTYTYNTIGWQLTEVLPAGNATGGTPSQHTITSSNFTGFGKPKTVTDQLGQATTYGYDADQNLTDVTDADGRHTVTTYNKENLPTLVTRPGAVTQATSYDNNGNISSQTDGLSNVTTYHYDALDRLTSVTDPASRVTSYTYDFAGNRKTAVQPGTPTGTLTTTYTYDNANELHTIAYSDGVTHGVTYGYDADGQRTSMADGTGTTSYVYDSLHRLTSSTNGHGRVVGYGYDIADRVTSLVYPNGSTLTRGYDDAGRLTSTTDWLSTPTTNTFGYDADGNWTSTTYGNADTAIRTFDRDDDLTGLTYKKGATTLGTLTYTRTNAALLATTTPSAGAPGTTDTYTRNARGQLTSSNGAGTTWAYDAADRITTAGTNTLAYDSTDQLTTSTPASGPVTSYAFDNRGERTSSTVAGVGASTTYAYDQAGDLTSYTPAGGSTSIYGYDGDGLRANKTPAGGSITYNAWDDATGSVPMLLSDSSTNFYVYGPDGTPIEQIKGSTNTYLMGDQNASTILLTGSGGTVNGAWTYDAYGNTTAHTGTATTVLLYNGQYTDAESGLIFLRARYYDPGTVQFLTRDPLMPLTRDAYGYAEEGPLDNSDPSGLWNWGLTSTILSAVCSATGVLGIAATATGVGAGVGVALEGVSLGTGLAATAIDCRRGVDLQCGLGVASSVAGGASLGVRGLGALDRLSPAVVAALDLRIGVLEVGYGAAAAVGSLGDYLPGSETPTCPPSQQTVPTPATPQTPLAPKLFGGFPSLGSSVFNG